MKRILIVDDDSHFASAAETLLTTDTANRVETAGSLACARKVLKEKEFDLMFVDIGLPDGNGLELVEAEGPPAVVVTGNPSMTSAIACVRGPFVDYLVKPLDRQRLMDSVANAQRHGSQNGQPVEQPTDPVAAPAELPAEASVSGPIVARSANMRKVQDAIERYVGNDNNVLISGETGTGKDLVARTLHERRSPGEPFVTINCGAVPRDQIANELFGSSSSDGSDASGNHVGAFEKAAGGTLFLDEISELPLGEQTVLLRALESRRVTRVGGAEQLNFKARVIAATSQDLGKLVKEGRFRKDLYYRLLVLPITLPPLRERREDVDALVRLFLDEFTENYGTPSLIAASALEKIRSYSWPGNVRELKNTVLRSAIIAHANEVIESVPLGTERTQSVDTLLDESLRPGTLLREMEKKLILATVEHFGGNRSNSAKALGISKKTLYNRLKKYGDDEFFERLRLGES